MLAITSCHLPDVCIMTLILDNNCIRPKHVIYTHVQYIELYDYCKKYVHISKEITTQMGD